MSAYEKSKGMVSIATGYSGGNFTYTKIDKYIQFATLVITPNMMQDLDSYRNSNGYLKRNVLSHSASRVAFNTPFMDENEMQDFMHILRLGVKQKNCSSAQNKVRVRYFNTKKNEYSHMYAYFPDVEFQIYGTYKGLPKYNPTSFTFIEY